MMTERNDMASPAVIPEAPPPKLALVRDMTEIRSAALAQIGTGGITTTPEQRSLLRAPVDPAWVAIRPDGAVYVPAVWYRQRLNAVFPNVGEWGLRPLGELQEMKSVLYREYALVIQGIVVDQVRGEQEYHPSNRDMTYGDAAEGTRSNALSRLCKNLGVFLEPWETAWRNAWKAKYAVRVWRTTLRDGKKQKPQWRRLDDDPFYDEGEPTSDSPNRDAWHRMRVTGRRSSDRAAGGVDKELITVVRTFTRGGVEYTGVKTTVGEYFTTDASVAQAAQAAKDAERGVMFVTEKKSINGRHVPSIVEMTG